MPESQEKTANSETATKTAASLWVLLGQWRSQRSQRFPHWIINLKTGCEHTHTLDWYMWDVPLHSFSPIRFSWMYLSRTIGAPDLKPCKSHQCFLPPEFWKFPVPSSWKITWNSTVLWLCCLMQDHSGEQSIFFFNNNKCYNKSPGNCWFSIFLH